MKEKIPNKIEIKSDFGNKDTVLVWLDFGPYSYTNLAITNELSKLREFDFVGIVATKQDWSFFQNQEFVKFKKLYYYPDCYIDKSIFNINVYIKYKNRKNILKIYKTINKMDTFIATIFNIFDNINNVKKREKEQQTQSNETKPQNKLINTYVEEKQYLAYYIYRIWIKYRTLMEYTNTVTEFNKILTSLNIPVKYFKYRVSFPMQNKMVNNEKQIDMVILMILKQMNTTC